MASGSVTSERDNDEFLKRVLEAANVPGIKWNDYEWAWSICGERSLMLELGLVREDWLVLGKANRRGYVCRKNTFQAFGREISAKTFKNSSKVEVYVRRTKEEEQHIKDREKAERVRAEVDKELSHMPASASAYSKREAQRLYSMLSVTADFMRKREYYGYYYSEETIEEFLEGAAELYWTLRNGKVLFDRKARESRVQELYGKVARADSGLQTFIREAIETVNDSITNE